MIGDIIKALVAIANHRRLRPLWGGLTAFVLFFAIALALVPLADPAPVQAQNTPCFRAQGGALWACNAGGAMEFRAGSTLSIDTFLTVEPQTALTLENNDALDPTGTFQPITAAGAIGISGGDIAAGDDGDLLILLNIGANTITITETTGLVSAGNIALGTLDSATLVYRNNSWYQIGASNN